MASKIDWNQVKEWDKKYLIHANIRGDEYGTVFVDHTEGDYLITPEGRRLLDFCNQLVCVNAGQNVPEIQNAIKDALDRFGFVWDIYTTDYKAELAKMLVEDILGDSGWASKVRFCLGGSDAVETAMHIARLYSRKPLIASRMYGYHGVSAGAVQATRIRESRGIGVNANEKVDPVPGRNYSGTFVCPVPFCFRCPLGQKYPNCKTTNNKGQLACVKMTEEIICNHGIENVAAIITEPALGAGIIVPPDDYLPQIEDMKNRLGILWIVDEVLMGFGRMGEWFGYQAMSERSVKPDIITTAKGITSSALPLGAVIVNKEIGDYMDSIRWMHVSTFSGHPLPLAAAIANLKYMIAHDAPGQSKKAGEYFRSGLQKMYDKHPSIGLFAGKGMFWEVELVKNRETNEPFFEEDRNVSGGEDVTQWPNSIISAKAMEKDVIIKGVAPNSLRIAASCFVTKEDMDKFFDAFDYALTYLEETKL